MLVFIGLPLLAGFVSKKILIHSKVQDLFEDSYKVIVGKVTIVALPITLIVLFALNGEVLIENPEEMIRVSIPLLIGFALVVGFTILMTKLFNLKYKEVVITALIGSSSHFEIAIATAVALFGLGSQAALGTTMGLFWEVPIMLGLVYLAKYFHRKGFWKD